MGLRTVLVVRDEWVRRPTPEKLRSKARDISASAWSAAGLLGLRGKAEGRAAVDYAATRAHRWKNASSSSSTWSFMVEHIPCGALGFHRRAAVTENVISELKGSDLMHQ
jgi:hypothetical protein